VTEAAKGEGGTGKGAQQRSPVLVDFEHWPYARRAAHRGAGKLAPENTLAAMRLGASFGYRMFEFDVKLSGDGVLVLMHDDTVERTTDGHGRLASMTLGEIAKLDAGSWHCADYAGEGIPTLARVAAWLNAKGLLANVEIKPCPGREAETGAAAALEARALWRDAPAPPLLSSFSEDALRAARRVAPELPRALLMHSLAPDWLERCRALGCVALDANHQALTREVIAQAHAARLRVACYTVNEPQRVHELTGWGVDCLITDAVDAIAPN
jgi:glycerophosphoryl diester phosphodiesterase